MTAPSVSKPAPVSDKMPWSIDFKTSGGFVGIGKGNMTVDSDGKYKCSHASKDQPVPSVEGTANARQQVVSSVEGTFYPRHLQPISEAVAQLDPKGWNKPGLNVSAADAFGYRLEFRSGPDKKEVVTIQWYDNTADQIPEDVKRLDQVLEQKLASGCVNVP